MLNRIAIPKKHQASGYPKSRRIFVMWCLLFYIQRVFLRAERSCWIFVLLVECNALLKQFLDSPLLNATTILMFFFGTEALLPIFFFPINEISSNDCFCNDAMWCWNWALHRSEVTHFLCVNILQECVTEKQIKFGHEKPKPFIVRGKKTVFPFCNNTKRFGQIQTRFSRGFISMFSAPKMWVYKWIWSQMNRLIMDVVSQAGGREATQGGQSGVLGFDHKLLKTWSKDVNNKFSGRLCIEPFLFIVFPPYFFLFCYPGGILINKFSRDPPPGGTPTPGITLTPRPDPPPRSS